MRKIIILFLFLVVSKFLAAQVIEIPKWLGTWQCVYTTHEKEPQTLTEKIVISEIHKRRFVQFEITGHPIDDSGTAYKYTAIHVFTFDFDKTEIVGWGFDNNGYKGVMERMTLTMTGDNKFIIKGESILYKLQDDWELLNENQIKRNRSIVDKISGETITSEAIFTKQ